jgi:hypothetical protein
MRTLTKKLANYGDRGSIGSRFRARRVGPLLSLMRSAFLDHGHVDLIDVGGTEQYWTIVPEAVLDEYDVRITILNVPGSPMPADHGRFRFAEGDGCDLGRFADGSFHIAHSNSVVEHVGDWSRMNRFAREIARLAPRYFVQTPNFWFFLEPHCMTPFFHWLPEPTRVFLVSRLELGHWSRGETVDDSVRIVESARLLSRRMVSALFSDASILTERFLGMAKSFIAVRDRAPTAPGATSASRWR